MACLSVLFPPLSIFPATMFAARVRASLKLLLHGTSLNRNRYYSTFISIFFQIFESAGNENFSKWLIRCVFTGEIVATSRRVVLDR